MESNDSHLQRQMDGLKVLPRSLNSYFSQDTRNSGKQNDPASLRIALPLKQCPETKLAHTVEEGFLASLDEHPKQTRSSQGRNFFGTSNAFIDEVFDLTHFETVCLVGTRARAFHAKLTRGQTDIGFLIR